ncbi:MAG: dephospho-CoA kinase, partial [Brachymonas sp.]|nr:dephospho-CoA kinase [Brachymonas sp.]
MAHPGWHIGLTGGIGSGKSTVAALLVANGAALVDADQIARDCTTHGGEAVEYIRATFGDQYIDGQGSLRRDAMRELVFAQPQARQQLEAIIHPIVQQQALKAGQEAEQQGKPMVVYEIPLLVESGHWKQRLHHVFVVDCDVETQIRRCMERRQ